MSKKTKEKAGRGLPAGAPNSSKNSSRYSVELKPLAGHPIPPLLDKFGKWLATVEAGSLGLFSLQVQSVSELGWPDLTPRLRRDGFAFLQTEDGSALLLVDRGKNLPQAVAMLGSEGATETIASSLEEFLVLLSQGETGVFDLDDEDADGRKKLRAWLSRNKIKPPTDKPFDFNAYLDGGAIAIPPPAVASKASVPKIVQAMTPLLRQVIGLIGRRADDPQVIKFVTGTLGKTVPDSTTGVNDGKWVVAKKQGLELLFCHDIKNEKYPPISKSKTSFLPYLSRADLSENFPEGLPFGLSRGMSSEQITKRLGCEPVEIGHKEFRRPLWTIVLDAARDVVFQADLGSVIRIRYPSLPEVQYIGASDKFSVSISQASELSGGGRELSVFLAWAISRDLLDESTFPAQRQLIAAIRKREQPASALLAAAMPRGMWDIHLKDLPDLRPFAYAWFHNIEGSYVVFDLIKVYGKRKGPYGHDEPKLDDDTWPIALKAFPALDKRFARWVKAKK